MARISLEVRERGPLARAAARIARRRYGAVPDPLAAMAHHRGVLVATARYELSVARRWTALDPTLQDLAVLAAAVDIGCSWCVDFGSWLARGHGLTEAKVRDVARWRESAAYDELERLVLEYAQAMTATPPTASDELVEALRVRLGEKGLVELTALVALENSRSRFNAALGLRSQGFADSCAVPEPAGTSADGRVQPPGTPGAH